MKARRALTNALLLIAAVVVPLVAAEVSLRLVVGKTTASVFVDRPGFERSRGMKPSYEAYVYGVPMMTNDLGFRDDSKTVPPKLSNNFRVLLLGNSVSVGLGIPYEQIFSSQLEQNLTAALGSKNLAPQVFNLAVGAYTPVEYRLTMEELGWALDPDFVVVALFVASDFKTRNLTPHSERGPLPWHQRTRLWQRLAPRIRVVENKLEQLYARTTKRDSGPRRPSFGPGAQGWSENTEALIALRGEAEARGVPFLVFLMPTTRDFDQQRARHEIVREFCNTNGIAVADLLPDFAGRKRRPETYRLNVIDEHPNADYHQIAGRLMSERILSMEMREAALPPDHKGHRNALGHQGGPAFAQNSQ